MTAEQLTAVAVLGVVVECGRASLAIAVVGADPAAILGAIARNAAQVIAGREEAS